MSPVSSALPGTPLWIDCQTSNLDVTQEFYSTVFGWRFSTSDASTRSASACVLAYPPESTDHPVASLSSHTHDRGWRVSLASDDVNSCQQRALALGAALPSTGSATANTTTPASSVDLIDPSGVRFSLQDSALQPGFRSSDQPGHVDFCELITTSMPAVVQFYVDLFHLDRDSYDEMHSGYTALTADGDFIASVLSISEGMRGIARPGWVPYISVADCTSTCVDLTAAGGTVLRPPYPLACGHIAFVEGPTGEQFHIIQQPRPASFHSA